MYERINRSLLRVLALSMAGTSCSDRVAESPPISVEIGGIKADDIQSSAFTRDKTVDGEPGKPYDAFLAEARRQLDGRDPSLIAVDHIVLSVGNDSRGIGANGFAEVFKTVEVFLSDGTTTIRVGTLDELPIGTLIEVPVVASDEDLMPLQRRLMSKDFKVGVRGTVVDAPPADFEIKTNVQLTFHAYE